MLLVAGFLAMAAADPRPPRGPVAQLYREACVQGEFRLNPKKGAIVRWRDLPEVVSFLRASNPQAERTTYIKMTYPPSTYLLITRYEDPKPGRYASECIVASRSIGFEEAMRTLLEGTGKSEATRSIYGGQWWDVHAQQQGYRKSLYLREFGFIVLKTTVFAPDERP
jgi:hypothetical protein